jgi:hypothetical protein
VLFRVHLAVRTGMSRGAAITAMTGVKARTKKYYNFYAASKRRKSDLDAIFAGSQEGDPLAGLRAPIFDNEELMRLRP